MIKLLKYKALIPVLGENSVRTVSNSSAWGVVFCSKYISKLLSVFAIVLLMGASVKVMGQTISATSLNPTSICPGDNVTVNFSWDNMNNGNETKTFVAQYENPSATWNNIGNIIITGAGKRSGSSSILGSGPGSNGTFSVRVIRTTQSSVIISNNLTLTVNQIPAAPTGISASPTAICDGSSATISVGNPGAGLTTDWFTGSCGGTAVSGGTGVNTLIVSPATTTTYYARTRNTATGCVSATCQNVTITVNPLPTASISGNYSPICEKEIAEFTITGTSGAVVTYNINSGTNATVVLTGGNATISNLIDVGDGDQTLTLVSVENTLTGCSQSVNTSSTITVNPIPEIGSFN